MQQAGVCSVASPLACRASRSSLNLLQHRGARLGDARSADPHSLLARERVALSDTITHLSERSFDGRAGMAGLDGGRFRMAVITLPILRRRRLRKLAPRFLKYAAFRRLIRPLVYLALQRTYVENISLVAGCS